MAVRVPKIALSLVYTTGLEGLGAKQGRSSCLRGIQPAPSRGSPGKDMEKDGGRIGGVGSGNCFGVWGKSLGVQSHCCPHF